MQKRGGWSRRKKRYQIAGDFKVIPLTKEAAGIINMQLEAFRKKFGRDPGPNDPIFFDPDADTPQFYSQEECEQYERRLHDVALTAGIDPAIVYAMRKTGRIVTEDNLSFLTDDEIQEWEDAIEEYHVKMTAGEN